MELFRQTLKDFFLFSPENPFIFTRSYFWIFFALVLIADALIFKRQKMRSLFLFFAGVFFYYKTSGFFFILLLFSIHFDYFLAKGVYALQHKKWRVVLVALSVIVNLSILAYFKYAYFFTESYNTVFNTDHEVKNWFAIEIRKILHPLTDIVKIFFGSDPEGVKEFFRFKSSMSDSSFFRVDKIILPVGISFYTFQTVSYTVDVYRGNVKPAKTLYDYGFFVSFFPQLVAGPIVRASDFIPQIYKPYSLSKADFGIALFWILNGLVKKIFIGDFIAVNFIDRVYENPGMYTGFENLLAILMYSLQVYCDFSGYTDIAIGIALLMGFHLTMNFNSPYKATDVGDFWRRWHMSLSTWLRDYLYIPLGGNKSAGLGSVLWLSVIGIFIGALSYSYWVNDFIGNPNISINEFIPALISKFQEITPKPADYFVLFCVSILSIFAPLAIFLFFIGLFIPSVRRFISVEINLMITMLLGGLWHGSSWLFVIWGGLNGLGIVFFKQWKKISPFTNIKSDLINVYAGVLTFLFISFTRIFFRARDMQNAKDVINRIFENFGWEFIPQIIQANDDVIFIFFLGMIFHLLPDEAKDRYRAWFAGIPDWAKGIICVLVVFIIYQTMSAELKAFIYFQF